MKKGNLVITLKIGEKVFVGSDIEVSIDERKGWNQYRVRIKAPTDVKIRRSCFVTAIEGRGDGDE